LAEAYSEEWWRKIAQTRAVWNVEGGERWANLIESIFPHGRPDEVSWSNIDQIVDVLEQSRLTSYIPIYDFFQLSEEAGGIPHYTVGKFKRIDKTDSIKWKEFSTNAIINLSVVQLSIRSM
jgi:hypothetical protein